MADTELGDLLYQRMAAEQEKYRAWLLTQPPSVILDHACAYTVREDIMVEMEDLRDVIENRADDVIRAEKEKGQREGR